jgi:hypothetical protein
MRWLEEIRVRTQPSREKKVMDLLLEAAESAVRNKRLKSARVFSHESAPAGFSLVLAWDTESIPIQGSETYMLILDGLKPLGLVDHTVLVERGRNGRQKA